MLFGWKLGEVIYEKVCASPRPLPQISLKHDGSEIARQATQPNLNANHNGGDPLFAHNQSVQCIDREPPTRSARQPIQ